MSVITSNSSIYPPIVENVLPAQSLSQTEIKIPFQLSPFNTPDDLYKRSGKIGVMVWIRLLKKKTGLEADYDRKFWVNVDPTDSTFKDENTNFSTLTLSDENGVYSFPIGLTAQSSGTALDLSAYIDCIFSIQLRVISKEYQQLDQNKEQWMSEWSKQCLFKIIPKVSLQIDTISYHASNHYYYFTNRSESQIFFGSLTFDKQTNEFLKYCEIFIYEDIKKTVLLEQIKKTFSENDNNNFNFVLKTDFPTTESAQCYIDFMYETNNGFKEKNSKTIWYGTYYGSNKTPQLSPSTITIKKEIENNALSISFGLNDLSSHPNDIIIQRTDEDTNFKLWEDVHTNNWHAGENSFIDNFIEDGKQYQYRIIGQTDNYRSKLVGKNDITDIIIPTFEDMSLIGKKQEVFHIKYNPNISNFQIRVADFVTETFGKYPFVRRNGNMRYKTFPIGGTIYIDDNIPLTQSINTVMNTSDIQQNTSVLSAKEKGFISQKKFRDEIMDFLYDGEIKLFKSPTEGNMLVRLTDISFTPRQEFGRMIYDFAATATEIDDYSLDNCKKYGIIS